MCVRHCVCCIRCFPIFSHYDFIYDFMCIRCCVVRVCIHMCVSYFIFVMCCHMMHIYVLSYDAYVGKTKLALVTKRKQSNIHTINNNTCMHKKHDNIWKGTQQIRRNTNNLTHSYYNKTHAYWRKLILRGNHQHACMHVHNEFI